MASKYTHVFSPFTIKGVTFRNRIINSPGVPSLASNDGCSTPQLRDFHAAFARGGAAVVTIGNTGPTIDPAELPLIFDRFHKTDKSRSTDRDGVGLGLYIVKTIVLAHGEDIYVTSRDGKTEFTFTMPLKK